MENRERVFVSIALPVRTAYYLASRGLHSPFVLASVGILFKRECLPCDVGSLKKLEPGRIRGMRRTQTSVMVCVFAPCLRKAGVECGRLCRAYK